MLARADPEPDRQQRNEGTMKSQCIQPAMTNTCCGLQELVRTPEEFDWVECLYFESFEIGSVREQTSKIQETGPPSYGMKLESSAVIKTRGMLYRMGTTINNGRM